MFWSTERFAAAIAAQADLITPFDRDRLKHGAYELLLGQGAVSSRKAEARGRISGRGTELRIPPGQFALLLTEEEVTIPHDAIGFISMKATVKLGGLINISGFHVDPGFHGKLKFSVYNAGDRQAVLTIGRPVFLLWLASLDRTTGDPYRTGAHQNQIEITDHELSELASDVPSPSALQDSIHVLERRVVGLEERRAAWTAIWTGFAGNLIAGLITLVVGLFVGYMVGRTNAPSGAPSQATGPPSSARDIGPDSLRLQTPDAGSVIRAPDAGTGRSPNGGSHR